MDEDLEREYKCDVCGEVFPEYSSGFYDTCMGEYYCSIKCLCKAHDIETIIDHGIKKRRNEQYNEL